VVYEGQGQWAATLYLISMKFGCEVMMVWNVIVMGRGRGHGVVEKGQRETPGD
jgi:hypothetical protein